VAGVIGVGAVGLIAVAAREHAVRRAIEREHRQAVEASRALEAQVAQAAADRDALRSELGREQQRGRELAEALAEARGELEQTVARLTEESQAVRNLQVRLTAMQQQMDQLQGELAMALQERQAPSSAGARQVELERVIVSNEALSALQGRVVSVHREWGFVVINLGWDAVRIGDTVSIFRGEQLQARARVERVQEGLCAATVLPDWQTDVIRVDDAVQVL
jgi:predicted RNase H-like nuclease (RuvC/YqgF family)